MVFETECIYEYAKMLDSLIDDNIQIIDKGSRTTKEIEINPMPFSRDWEKYVTTYYIIY